MDLADPISIKKAVETVISEQGKIDVLINNAGMHLGGPIEEAPAELFTRTMNTNFNGLVHIVQAVLPHMRHNGGGTIINLVQLVVDGLPFQAFYLLKFFNRSLNELARKLKLQY